MHLIISVEGIESNTEVNFYNGLAHHIEHKILISKAIGKLANNPSQEKLNKFINIVKTMLRSFKVVGDVDVWYIGDGDTDIPAMENAIVESEKLIKEIFPNWIIHKKLIKDDGTNFDNVLRKAGFKKLSNHKKGTNKRLFNDFGDEIKLFNKEKINFQKLLKVFEDSNHYQLIKTVIE